MAGGTHPKAASSPSPSSSHRKSSRWESDKKPSDKKPSTTSSSKPPTPKPTSNPKENPKPISNPSPGHPKPPTDPIPHPGFGPISPPPIPPPSYGFHMLERRTIGLADGSVRSYFALPPDYKDFTPPPPRPMLPAQGGLGFGRGFHPLGPMSPEFRDREDLFARDRNPDYLNLLKRKGGGDGDERGGRDGSNDELARQRQHLLQYGNAGSVNPNRYPVGGLDERGEFMAGPSNNRDVGRGDEFRAAKFMRVGGGYENFRGGSDNVGLSTHNDVDQSALKKAFLHYVKVLNENPSQKKNYLENGKQAPLQCIACGRFDKIGPNLLLSARNTLI